MKILQIVRARDRATARPITDSIVQIADALQKTLGTLGLSPGRIDLQPGRVVGAYPEFSILTAHQLRSDSLRGVTGVTVLCHEWGALPALRLYGFKRIVQVVHCHHQFDRRAEVLRRLYYLPDVFLVASPESREALQLVPMDPCPTFAVAQHPHLEARAKAERSYDLLWVGRLDLRKNLADFLSAVEVWHARLGKPSVGVFVEDAPPGNRGLPRLKEAMAHIPEIELHVGEDAGPYLRSCKALVSTSHWECSPRVVVEAGMAGAQLLLPELPWARQFLPSAVLGPISLTLPTFRRPVDPAQRSWFTQRYSATGSLLLKQWETFLQQLGILPAKQGVSA